MKEILVKQLACDFCVSESMVSDKENHFSVYEKNPKRRIFESAENCFLKIAAFNGKILATGEEEIISWCRKEFAVESGDWFMDMETLRKIEQKVVSYGYRIGQAHPFYTADRITDADTKDFEMKKYVGDEIIQFEGDKRFDEAFLFADRPKDEIGICAEKDGILLGMAGATSDSETMWQIGINVMPEAEGMGVGSTLVEILKNEILKLGKLPFYGTSMSHIASQRVALKAGFLPAWAELYCEKIVK